MNRITLVAAVVAGCGTTLTLGELRWFRVLPLASRLEPYRSGLRRAPRPSVMSSATPIREVIVPLLVGGSTRIAMVLGTSEPLAVRLQRSNARVNPHEFRLRQGVAAVVSLLLAIALSPLLPTPATLNVAFVAIVPVAIILGSEHHLARRSAQWQQRFLQELPTVAEQLGLLMGAGYSLTAAMARIASRTTGECSIEFRRVQHRIAQGSGEATALAESATRVGLDAYRRLVTVLTLNREAADLGTLITNEAQHVRHLVHRQRLEMLEARGQQVWIPVTVATLVPGVVFLAIPFVDAMSQLTT